MSQYTKRFFLLSLVMLLLCGIMAEPVYASQDPQQKTAVRKKRAGNSGKAKTSANKKSAATAGSKSAQTKNKRKTATKKETSADVKKRQEATQKEIRLTEQQIKENEKSVRLGLSELGKLEGEISASKKKISETTGKINALSGKIGTLESGITKNESELRKLRDEYLKAVKKMRVAQKNKSGLAFVFASDNFNQALRRMRYLKQFSAWKDRQSAAIGEKTAQLKTQRDQLASAKTEQDKALRLQKSEQSVLQQQYGKQDALVADLKANGKALQTHLSKKQAEANELRNRISALIAEEERRAAEERARQEAAKRAEEERLARIEEERLARLEAERKAEVEAAKKAEEEAAILLAQKEKEAKAGDKKAKEEAEKLRKEQEKAAKKAREAEEKRKKELAQLEAKRKEAEKKAAKEAAKESKKDDAGKSASKESNKNYADARKRTPRTSSGATSTTASAVASSAKGNFAAMRGSLPKPVSGSFKVTSRFGRQSLPDLPDVIYDNPGIDAEVSAGSSALAVYGGKVSGVYMIPGYNTVVIVNHGNYYTVYGNIASPSVKVGDSVNAGQGLGSLALDEDDRSRSSIHFEVWRNREKLNPLDWLR